MLIAWIHYSRFICASRRRSISASDEAVQTPPQPIGFVTNRYLMSVSDFNIIFQPMSVEDIPTVEELEKRCFPTPWSAQTYYNELVHNQLSFYWVLRPHPPGSEGVPQILAYGGYWLTGDEAHIVTIATHPNYRRQHLGQLLLERMIERAHTGGAHDITLEVRASNHAAQELYKKLGFVAVGLRKKYYRDNGEDAVLMTLFLPHNKELHSTGSLLAD